MHFLPKHPFLELHPVQFLMLYIVGDEAFPLKPYLMRPYPGRKLPESKAIYNYRLSRARRVIENCFGILASRWKIFCRPIIAVPEHAVVCTKAAVMLHNFLHTTESSVYCPLGFTDKEDSEGNVLTGAWREDFHYKVWKLFITQEATITR